MVCWPKCGEHGKWCVASGSWHARCVLGFLDRGEICCWCKIVCECWMYCVFTCKHLCVNINVFCLIKIRGLKCRCKNNVPHTRTLCCRTCQRENTFAINVLHVATCTLVGNTHEPRAPKTFCAEVLFFLKVNELHLQDSNLVGGVPNHCCCVCLCPCWFASKIQFHQNPLSSKTSFINKQFDQNPISSKCTFSSKNQFHLKPFSSQMK